MRACLERIRKAAALAGDLGLECHAGHGLTFDTVGPVAVIPTIAELNIGHFLIGEAIFSGLDSAIRRMLPPMNKARPPAGGPRSACLDGAVAETRRWPPAWGEPRWTIGRSAGEDRDGRSG